MKVTIFALFVIWSNGYAELEGSYKNKEFCEWNKGNRVKYEDARKPARYECVAMTGSID
jgi:hypothetical protein